VEETNEAFLINATRAEASVLSPLPLSVQKRRTATIRNRKSTLRHALENLFSEKQTDWKRQEFVKACLKKNIYLDNNVETNMKKLFTWFDGRKNRMKQMASL
ncbi:4379_t:CDS:2, partial [Dentiscutata heterogama]